ARLHLAAGELPAAREGDRLGAPSGEQHRRGVETVDDRPGDHEGARLGMQHVRSFSGGCAATSVGARSDGWRWLLAPVTSLARLRLHRRVWAAKCRPQRVAGTGWGGWVGVVAGGGLAEAGGPGPGDGFGARRAPDFGVDGTNLRLDRVARDEELGGELLEGRVLRESREHHLLPARQRFHEHDVVPVRWT